MGQEKGQEKGQGKEDAAAPATAAAPAAPAREDPAAPGKGKSEEGAALAIGGERRRALGKEEKEPLARERRKVLEKEKEEEIMEEEMMEPPQWHQPGLQQHGSPGQSGLEGGIKEDRDGVS